MEGSSYRIWEEDSILANAKVRRQHHLWCQAHLPIRGCTSNLRLGLPISLGVVEPEEHVADGLLAQVEHHPKRRNRRAVVGRDRSVRTGSIGQRSLSSHFAVKCCM